MSKKKQRITVLLGRPEVIEVDAFVFGAWAAHESLGDIDGWSVTHRESGTHLGWGFPRKQALRIAQRLGAFVVDGAVSVVNQRVPDDMRCQIEAVVAEVIA